jgi:hypothetical protein
MFSLFELVLASLKFADPVITVGEADSGSTSMNLVCTHSTLIVSPDISASQRSKLFVRIRLPIATRTLGRRRISAMSIFAWARPLPTPLGLHQRHAEHLVVGSVDVLELLRHPEGDGHEERLLRVARDLGVPVQDAEAAVGREDGGDIRVPRFRRARVVGPHPGALGRAFGFVVSSCQ